MAITQAEFDFKLKVTETVALGIDSLTDQAFVFQIATDTSAGTKTPSTQVPCTEQWQDSRSLAAGTDTIDLTALPNGNLANKNFTGLKVQFIKIRNRSTNTAAIVVADGATNGYNIFGDASGQVTIPAGMTVLFGADTTEGLQDVAGADKTIDVTSSDVDATYDVQIVAG